MKFEYHVETVSLSVPERESNIIGEIKKHVLAASKELNLSKFETDLLEASIDAGYEHSKDLCNTYLKK